MKKFVLLIFISILLKSTSVFANERLAECSALNNNLNHKYGSQLLDKGETQNTVMNDSLYKSSSIFQVGLMAKVSYTESWDLSSYKNFQSEFQKSDFFGRVFFYDTISMQRLSVGKLLQKVSKYECFKKFKNFIRTPGKKKIILDKYNLISTYLKKMRGF